MLLTSGGVPADGPILETLRELVGSLLGRCRSIVLLDAILPFAGYKTQLLDDLGGWRDLGWGEVDLVTLGSGPPSRVTERLRSADVVLGYGGSDHWLGHAWRASGLVPVLREVVDSGVYVGWSAGSMVFSRMQSAVVEAMDDRGELARFELEDTAPALALFDWFSVPHLGATFFPHATDAWAASTAARLGGPSWFLDDRSALLIRDASAEPTPVSDGHWLRFDGAGALVASR